MAVAVRKIRGLSEAEYAEIKQAAKVMRFVTVSRNTGVNGCHGTINLRPLKNSGYSWTREQWQAVYSFIKANDLHSQSYKEIDGEFAYEVFHRGTNYLYKLGW